MSPKVRGKCFVIMPFDPALHYFYLYIERHIWEKHGIQCKRGDTDILTIPVLEKIRTYVAEADVLIADCSGRNPNVFYELGMAHTLAKNVILITRDPVESAPTDIRHFEFIRYRLDKHTDFLYSLDKALREVFVDRYDDLYSKAIEIFHQFKESTGSSAEPVAKSEFIERIVAVECRSGFLRPENEVELREFLLPKALADMGDIKFIGDMWKWLEEASIGSTP